MQVQTLLFGGARNKDASKDPLPLSRDFTVPNQRPAEPGQKRAKKNMVIKLHK